MNKKKDSSPKSKKKRNIRTFEADKDVAEMIDAAVEAGLTQHEILNEALREAAPAYLAKVAEKFRRKADGLEQKISGPKN